MKITVQKNKPDFNKILFNALKNAGPNLPLPTHVQGHALLNSAGDVDPNSSGFRYIIDTLTMIKAKIIEQKFFQVSIGDYLPINIGQMAWMETVIQNVVFLQGGSFYDGDIGMQTNNGRVSTVDASLGQISMPAQPWAKGANWTIIEIAKAALVGNWDVVASKLSGVKKDWDLGIQENAFLGHPTNSKITGLLNNSDIVPNTTLLAGKISDLDATDFATFVSKIVGTYYTNTNRTAFPNKFIIPTDDYLGLVAPVSASFPFNSKLEYLLSALKTASMNMDFKILPLAYCQADVNDVRGIGKDRYVLYNDDSETLGLEIPVDFTMLEADTSNKFNWQQVAYGQYSGVLMPRPLEVMYIDKTEAST